MFNVTIKNEQYNEQYDEYLAQKEKIKELESLVDLHRQKAIAADGMYHHEHIKNAELKRQNDALIKENDRLKKCNKFFEKEHVEISELNLKQGESIIADKALIANQDKMIETLQAKIADYDNKDIRFKEIVTENYRLRMSNNNLKENNEALKKENEKLINRLHDYESQIAELAEKATNPDYVKFLETVKKFQESNVGILTELEEATQPERNVIIIENLYLTNNYFHEEDKDDE